ncbi:unnamed protein product [Paramecium pentaurelia]|uniref:Tetratricopeptide repeat protein n=1 Tax=Paramecium pentaurelia TaxID=43138 RepID=A0A8S1YG81_9CILI|nr:unnamed protein product [Paramecium pentaurelia]
MSRGNFLDQIEYQQEALLDFNKAIELDPYDDCIYNNRLLFTKIGNINQALIDFNKAIELDPNFSDFYLDRGNQSIIFYKQIMNNRPLQIMIKRWNEILINLKHIIIEAFYNLKSETQTLHLQILTNQLNQILMMIILIITEVCSIKILEKQWRLLKIITKQLNQILILLKFTVQDLIRFQVIIALLHLSLENKDQAIIDHNKAINQILKMLQIILTDDCFIDYEEFDLVFKDYTKAIELNSNDAKAYNNKVNFNYNQKIEICIKQMANMTRPFKIVFKHLNQNQTIHLQWSYYNQSLNYYTQALEQLDQITQQKSKKWNFSEENIQLIKKKQLCQKKFKMKQFFQDKIFTKLQTQFEQKNPTFNDVNDKLIILEKKINSLINDIDRFKIAIRKRRRVRIIVIDQRRSEIDQIIIQLILLQEIVSQQNKRISNLEDDNKYMKEQDSFQIQESMKFLQKQKIKLNLFIISIVLEFIFLLVCNAANFFRTILNEQRCYDRKHF